MAEPIESDPEAIEALPVELPIEFEAYLTHLIVERGRATATLKAYRADLLRWCGFLAGEDVQPLEAMPEHVVAFADLLSDLGLAQSSVTRTVISVRGVYRYLATEGITQTDPTANFETASTPNALPKALTEDEVLAILNAVGELAAEGDPIGTRDLALLEFLYGTGARVSEACGIDFVDLDLDGALVRVMGKRSKERIVPLGGPSTRALRNYLDFGRPELISGKTQDRADSSAVFIGQRGRRLSRQAAWVAIRKWAVAAGV